MDIYEGANEVNALVLYVTEMKSMTVDTTHTDVCMSVVSVYLHIVVAVF